MRASGNRAITASRSRCCKNLVIPMILWRSGLTNRVPSRGRGYCGKLRALWRLPVALCLKGFVPAVCSKIPRARSISSTPGHLGRSHARRRRRHGPAWRYRDRGQTDAPPAHGSGRRWRRHSCATGWRRLDFGDIPERLQQLNEASHVLQKAVMRGAPPMEGQSAIARMIWRLCADRRSAWGGGWPLSECGSISPFRVWTARRHLRHVRDPAPRQLRSRSGRE